MLKDYIIFQRAHLPITFHCVILSNNLLNLFILLTDTRSSKN